MRPATLCHRIVLAAALLWGAAATAASAAEQVPVLAVTASSTDGMLMDAVDDDATTFWQCKAGERDAWLAVRFEAPAWVRGVRVQTGAGQPAVEMEVETSPDGLSYQGQLRRQVVRDERAVEWRFPKKVQALYVRVKFHYTGDGTPPRHRLAEFEALAAD